MASALPDDDLEPWHQFVDIIDNQIRAHPNKLFIQTVARRLGPYVKSQYDVS